MDFKLFGSILLIVGTSIGAGMLALPVAMAGMGFIGSVVLLFGCWFIMTVAAFLLLEANLWLPQNSNLISMAKSTLGSVGQWLAWILYLLLLYSLLCAYIAGGSDLLHHALLAKGWHLSTTISLCLFTFIFGFIVYLGMHFVDHVNRILIFIKLGTFILFAVLLAPYLSASYLMAGDMKDMIAVMPITVTITAFGYATIIPSIRIYLAGDIKKIKLAILIGSGIPLFCYILWNAFIMGVIPENGTYGLKPMLASGRAASELVIGLSMLTARPSISFLANVFTSICVLTSFLGASLCLVDFLADGLKQEKTGMTGIMLHLLVFMPPFLIVLFYPRIFIQALEYAGIYCILLLIFLPACIVWRGRPHFPSAKWKMRGGSFLLWILMIFSLVMMIWSLIGQ